MYKILVIPSWYPTKESRLIGSFFEEQVRFLYNHGFEIRVLYVLQTKKNCRKFLYRNQLHNSLTIEKTDSNPITIYVNQTVYNLVSLKEEIETLLKGYLAGWRQLTANGWRPDIIHAQSTLNAGIVAFKLNKLLSIPYLITEHIPLFFNNRCTLQDTLIIQSLENATKVGVVSYHLLRHILMQNVKINSEIIWNYIDESRFFIKKKIRKGRFTIVTVAYPAYIKDLITFFKAIQYLYSSSNMDFDVYVVGNQNYSESKSANTLKTEEIAQKYNIHDKCTFIPYISRHEMADFLSLADVYICTSISETFGVAIREALMCGVPVISTRNGGAEDVINTKNGFLVNLHDYISVANHVIQLAQNKIAFDAKIIRQTAIDQSGSEAFYRTMKNFYTR
jgi:glycosyltransferase involved in cell wall biosynthesis